MSYTRDTIEAAIGCCARRGPGGLNEGEPLLPEMFADLACMLRDLTAERDNEAHRANSSRSARAEKSHPADEGTTCHDDTKGLADWARRVGGWLGRVEGGVPPLNEAEWSRRLLAIADRLDALERVAEAAFSISCGGWPSSS